jgi:hypothetical protein
VGGAGRGAAPPHDPDPRPGGDDPSRGRERVAATGKRRIDDHHVRLELADPRLELLAARHLADDVDVALPLEEGPQAAAHQWLVMRDDHADGEHAPTMAPRRRRVITASGRPDYRLAAIRAALRRAE